MLGVGGARVSCPHLLDRQAHFDHQASEAAELVIEALHAHRQRDAFELTITLRGRFANAADQNLYLFFGAPSAEAASYALSEDAAFFSESAYPIRSAVSLPHTIDLRVGVMAPETTAYSPQVYGADQVRTLMVGVDAHLGLAVGAHEVRLRVPVAEYYRALGRPVPERLVVSVATARDYVGFIDQRSVPALAEGAAASATPSPLPAASYPQVNRASREIAALALDRQEGALAIMLETRAPIVDWAQTNVHFFLVSMPATLASKRVFDPSHTTSLPFGWAYYCGVYSPKRVFCRPSTGSDFSYDAAYSERRALAAPTGVSFTTLGGARYRLSLPEEELRSFASAEGVALIVSIGRDGQGPDTWYGSRPDWAP